MGFAVRTWTLHPWSFFCVGADVSKTWNTWSFDSVVDAIFTTKIKFVYPWAHRHDFLAKRFCWWCFMILTATSTLPRVKMMRTQNSMKGNLLHIQYSYIQHLYFFVFSDPSLALEPFRICWYSLTKFCRATYLPIQSRDISSKFVRICPVKMVAGLLPPSQPDIGSTVESPINSSSQFASLCSGLQREGRCAASRGAKYRWRAWNC